MCVFSCVCVGVFSFFSLFFVGIRKELSFLPNKFARSRFLLSPRIIFFRSSGCTIFCEYNTLILQS